MQVVSLFAGIRKSLLLRIVVLALALVGLVLMLNTYVFAQNTFVITDGDKVIVHTTDASDPSMALKEAGVHVTDNSYIATQSSEGVYDIKVLRNDKVNLVDRGRSSQVTIQDPTVGQLLNRAGVVLDKNCRVSVPLDTEPYDGLQIVVEHVVTVEEVYTVDIPYSTSMVDDPYLPEGMQKVVSEGEVGQLLRTASVQYRNTKEISRRVIREEVLQEPMNRVIAVGTGELVGQKPDMPLIGEDVIILPSGEVLTYYKKDTYEATAYTQYDAGCNDTTACMTKVRWGVVAVDTDLIPYGTRMFIMRPNGEFIYGIGTAEDCGGAIQGKRLDLYMPTLAEAFQFGRKEVDVYFLGDANWTF